MTWPPNGNTTITTMAAAGGNGLLEPCRMPYVPLQRVVLIEDDPPSKRICFLWGLIGHMPLKTLWCCGGASSLEQRSVLRGIHPINPTPKHIRVGLNIPQIELLAIWVGGMHCVIVTKLWGAQIFGVVGLNSLWCRTHEPNHPPKYLSIPLYAPTGALS